LAQRCFRLIQLRLRLLDLDAKVRVVQLDDHLPAPHCTAHVNADGGNFARGFRRYVSLLVWSEAAVRFEEARQLPHHRGRGADLNGRRRGTCGCTGAVACPFERLQAVTPAPTAPAIEL